MLPSTVAACPDLLRAPAFTVSAVPSPHTRVGFTTDFCGCSYFAALWYLRLLKLLFLQKFLTRLPESVAGRSGINELMHRDVICKQNKYNTVALERTKFNSIVGERQGFFCLTAVSRLFTIFMALRWCILFRFFPLRHKVSMFFFSLLRNFAFKRKLYSPLKQDRFSIFQQEEEGVLSWGCWLYMQKDGVIVRSPIGLQIPALKPRSWFNGQCHLEKIPYLACVGGSRGGPPPHANPAHPPPGQLQLVTKTVATITTLWPFLFKIRPSQTKGTSGPIKWIV